MPIIEADDPRLLWVDIEEAKRFKKGVCTDYTNYWWIVHPTKDCIAFWSPTARIGIYGMPQCNHDEAVTRKIFAAMYPWARVQQISNVCMPWQ
jgi:hypothetical protein